MLKEKLVNIKEQFALKEKQNTEKLKIKDLESEMQKQQLERAKITGGQNNDELKEQVSL